MEATPCGGSGPASASASELPLTIGRRERAGSDAAPPGTAGIQPLTARDSAGPRSPRPVTSTPPNPSHPAVIASSAASSVGHDHLVHTGLGVSGLHP